MQVIAVIGRSGAGKTTFLCRLVAALRQRGLASAVVKHCGSGFDLGGADKDSTRLLRAGAEAVTLSGPKGIAVVRSPGRRSADRDFAAEHAGADFVFIEGGRTQPGIPVIEIVGQDPKNRPCLRAADRWIIVSRCPVASSGPVFSPARIGEIASLLSARRTESTGTREATDRKDFFRAHDPAIRRAVENAVVAVAGAGGLGSNVAAALARCGVGMLILADFDRIEPSNLNRQQYYSDQIGRYKVDALAENLRRIPSGTKVEARRIRVTAGNVPRLFGKAGVLVEAFDRAEEKQMLIEAWMARFPDRPVVAASGLAGYGGNNRIRERRIGTLTIIGDESTEAAGEISPLAPRVAMVAAMQANRVIEILMKTGGKERKKRC